MFELCCKYLSTRCIWLYAIIMSRTRLSVCGFESSSSHCLAVLIEKNFPLDFIVGNILKTAAPDDLYSPTML